MSIKIDFYSRPCGRGDNRGFCYAENDGQFLLTPLREGRPMPNWSLISPRIFLLTPLREGRQ